MEWEPHDIVLYGLTLRELRRVIEFYRAHTGDLDFSRLKAKLANREEL